MGEPSARVLVIEDARNWREYLQVLLQSMGYHVQVADGLDQGMRALPEGPYDLAIVDARLYEGRPEDESGLDIIRTAWAQHAVARFIVLSGNCAAARVHTVLGDEIPYRMFDKSESDSERFRLAVRTLIAEVSGRGTE